MTSTAIDLSAIRTDQTSYKGTFRALIGVYSTAEVDDLIAGVGGGSVVWGDIGGTLSNQTDLQNALNAKANSSHTHSTAEVTGLDAALAAKASTTYVDTGLAGKANSSHTHSTSEVTGLDAALSGKQATLVSGTNIKTINGVSVLGSGNIIVSGGIGGSTGVTDNAVLRADGTGGGTAQSSSVIIDDSGNILATSVGPSSNNANFRINVPTYGASANYGELYFNTTASYHSYCHITAAQPMSGGPNNFGMVYYNNNQFTLGFYSGARIYWSGAGSQGMLLGTWTFPASAGYPSANLAAESNGGGDVRWTVSKTGNGANQTITGYTYAYALTGIPAALDLRARSIQLGAYSDVSSSHAWNDTNITNKLLIESGSNGSSFTGRLSVSDVFSVGTYTVATLPSASANAGKEAQVTDSSVTTYRSTVAGGGANRVKVFSDGTNWLVGG